MFNAIRDTELIADLYRSPDQHDAQQYHPAQEVRQTPPAIRPADRDIEDMIALSEMMRNALRRLAFNVN